MGLYKLRTDFGHHFKWLLILIAFGFLVGGLYVFTGLRGGGPSAPGGQGAPSDELATVGGMPVSRGEFEAAWTRQVEALRDSGMRSTLQFARKRAELFQSLIGDRVMLGVAKELGVEVSNADVQRKLDELVTIQLRDNRRAVLGQLSPERERTDPRYDAEYKDELAKNDLSLGIIEDRVRAFVSEAKIQGELAQDGVRRKITERVGAVTPQDVTNSFNIYAVRQIAIGKNSMPPDQLRTRVDKIVAEARAGKDFAALGKQYSQDGGRGGVQPIAFGQVSPEIWDQVSKLKAGQVGDPMDTDQAVYIVKVEGVTAKLPAKFDQKAQNERRQMIQGIRAWQEGMKVQQQVRKKLAVNVTDPECLGYWQLAQIGGAAGNPAEMKRQLGLARAAFEKAIAQDANNAFATAMLAVVLADMGDAKQATRQLYYLLEGPSSRGEGADLRIMLGDLLLQSKRKDEAVKQYAKASEAAGMDPAPHQQLVAKFEQVGRPDLAAKEQQWLADYETKRKLIEAQRAKSGAPTTPAP